MEDKDIRQENIAYITFVLGYELVGEICKQQANMHYDEIYEYCRRLAEQFYGSQYDDEDYPIRDCLENFVNANIKQIYEDVWKIREKIESCG